MHFEHTHHLSEAEFVDLHSGFLGYDRSRQSLRRVTIIALGVVCLFWEYTLLFGTVLLVVATIHMFVPRILPATASRNYREFKYLDGPITYAVDGTQVSLKGTDFEVRAAWRHLAAWLERDPWLVLRLQATPMVILPVAQMRAQGVYDDVTALVRQHAPNFDSPEARRWPSKKVRRPPRDTGGRA